VGTPGPGAPLPGGRHPADLPRNPGVITNTLLSGVIAGAVAAAEWTGSGEALGSPTGLLRSLVALLGVVAVLPWARPRATPAAAPAGALPALTPDDRAGHEMTERPLAAVGSTVWRWIRGVGRASGPDLGKRSALRRPSRARPGLAELPTGTVTFLFTDIEGSTRLLQELGDRYAAVRDEHAAILRHAIQEGGGVEVNTEGDSFFVAFPSPAGAVRVAVIAQQSLAGYDWSPGPPVRVRMGLHTGDGTLGGDDYVGIDVHRAARIAGAAHGGQVLLSGTTRALVEHALPEGASLRDLGVHRLKDIALPERLHEIVVEGLSSDFPAPRTLDARPNNLPVQLTSFVGREEELAEVRRLLGGTRLLTLTGAGGSGKSRLALQVAAELLPDFRDGAFFADLSSVTDPALVPSVVAHAVGAPQVTGRPVLEAVTQHLRDKQVLFQLSYIPARSRP
jgi:class 3 adenylate cyclase